MSSGTRIAAVAALVLFAVACAGRGGALRPEHCEIRVVQVAQWDVRPGSVRAAWTVQGRAGSPAKAWLAARNPSGSFVSGEGRPVGPGPFTARIGLDLDRTPQKYVAVLEVAGRRCTADARIPR